MLFLGTGAAELVPNPFCKCELCQRVRAGKETPRKRSALLLDKEICIDFGPDVLAASQQYDAPLYDLTDIFITHTHNDHLSIDNLDVLTMTECRDFPIRLWLSPEGVDWIYQYCTQNRCLHRGTCGLDELLQKGKLSIQPLLPYRWHTIGKARVFAVVSNHPGCHKDEFSLNYVIEKDGHRILYAADTGLYSQENLSALKDFQCDTVIMEGTYGSWQMDKGISHLTAETYIENAENLVACGAVKADGKFYVTHINQCHSFHHQAYQDYLAANCKLDITVAWDGMEI